jgi:ADP-heptose:LPS heptosyltransferase
LKKILVIRFSSIGDIVLTTPVVRCLKQQIPDAQIHFLTKKQFTGLLENNPYLSKVYSFEKNILEVLPDLKKEDFDFVIDLHNNLRSLQVKQALGKPSKSFYKLNFKKFILVKLKINKMPALHVVDRYMQTVSFLGVKNDNKGLDFFIPLKDEVKLSSLPKSHQRGYLGFVIGAKHFTKQLPIEKIIAICKKIDKPIVLLGGKEEVQRAEKIQKEVGLMIYNACGKYNLNQSASLVRQASTIISHDTGLMHIASAFKKQIISVWGNTVPAFGFTPYMSGADSKMIEVEHLNCRPCSKIGYNKCPKKHFRCMNDIAVEEFDLLFKK